jgi:AcrR family transcriptional regulator
MNSAASTALSPEQEQRHRVLSGLANALVHKGYADITIADIVAHAAISRRTFYEHFDTKAHCFLALFETVSVDGVKVLARQIQTGIAWQQQVELALQAYFEWMKKNPVLLRTLFIDILALGAEGLKVRRKVHDQIADFINKTLEQDQGQAKSVPRAHLVAMVGGIHELVLEQLEIGELSDPAELAKLAAQFVRSVL